MIAKQNFENTRLFFWKKWSWRLWEALKLYTKQNDRFGIISSNGSLQPVSELPELEKAIYFFCLLHF